MKSIKNRSLDETGPSSDQKFVCSRNAVKLERATKL